MYEKINQMVKPLEFVFMIGLPILGLFFGGVSLLWCAIIVVAYLILQLTGWGTKTTQEVIDETKGNIKNTQEELKKFKK